MRCSVHGFDTLARIRASFARPLPIEWEPSPYVFQARLFDETLYHAVVRNGVKVFMFPGTRRLQTSIPTIRILEHSGDESDPSRADCSQMAHYFFIVPIPADNKDVI